MTEKEFLQALEARYVEFRGLGKFDNFNDYEKEFVVILHLKNSRHRSGGK